MIIKNNKIIIRYIYFLQPKRTALFLHSFLQCDKDGSLPIATHTATDSTGHTLDHVLKNLTPESCLQFKCLLEVGSQSVSDTNDVGILYREYKSLSLVCDPELFSQ